MLGWCRDLVLELQRSIVLCNSVSADLTVMAASRLLGACVILLYFAAGHRKSYWSGCIKVAIVICRAAISHAVA